MNRIVATIVLPAALFAVASCGAGAQNADQPSIAAATVPVTTQLVTSTSTSVVPSSTTSVVPIGRVKLDEIIQKCHVTPGLMDGDQVVLELFEGMNPSSEAHVAYLCIEQKIISAGGKAVLGTASGAQGPVSVEEGGVKFTQIYSAIKGQEADILIIEVAE
jgi:hypothetical protein